MNVNLSTAEIVIIYSSLALLLGVVKCLLDHRRNEILEETGQATLLVYQAVQDMEQSVQDGCNDLVWTINSAVSGDEAEGEEDGAEDDGGVEEIR